MPRLGIRIGVGVGMPVHSLILCGTGSACLSCTVFFDDDRDFFHASNMAHHVHVYVPLSTGVVMV